MKTTVMAKSETVDRKWYIVDATDIPLGRVASQVAAVLRGKNKTIYTPHVDTGDYVIVINTDKMILTGNKLNDKKYYHHSGYPGGIKEETYKDIMAKKSDFALERAIKGMLPKNSLGRKMFKKLKCYKGSEHPHEAQQPVALSIKGGRR
ncbi:MAG: 50S ribosomal protein L13 [Clostridiales bacterium]|nr:50S ribosomal protein L13 [Clostridiales bacterium]